MSLIAIDYDDTYTADPVGWGLCIVLMQSRGHEVICVTYRSDAGGMEDGPWSNIISTNGRAKAEFCSSVGYNVDIWIDDKPHLILNSYSVK
jgi:hypothetical protein